VLASAAAVHRLHVLDLRRNGALVEALVPSPMRITR
jgi:hypothetical protein